MRKLLTLLLVMLHITGFSQESNSSLDETAFDYYLDHKYDSAIILYERLLQRTKSGNAGAHEYLGKCYTAIGKPEIAITHFYECLNDTSESQLRLRGCCLGISRAFNKVDSHQKALRYLEMAQQKYPYRAICSNGEFSRKARIKYRYAKCFEGLQQIDSAIKYLTPYVFGRPKDVVMDSMRYLEIVHYYHDLIGKTYSDSVLKQHLKSALANLHYKKTDIKAYKSREGNWKSLEVYFHFLGTKVVIYDIRYEAESWGGEPVERLSESKFRRIIQNLPAYKMIINS